MKNPAFEAKFTTLAVAALGIFLIGAVMTTIVPPLVDKDLVSGGERVIHNYSDQEQRGLSIYQREGCVYCHTQQIRAAVTRDPERYGWRLVDAPPSESWEYVNDRPHFLGTKRTGPDLARIGGKYASQWHWAHFKNPRDLGERFTPKTGNPQTNSLMPSYRFLSDEEIKDLTSYMQTLGRNLNWRVLDGKALNDYED